MTSKENRDCRSRYLKCEIDIEQRKSTIIACCMPTKVRFLPERLNMEISANWFRGDNEVGFGKAGLSVQSVQCGKTSCLFGLGVCAFGHQKQSGHKPGKLDTERRS